MPGDPLVTLRWSPGTCFLKHCCAFTHPCASGTPTLCWAPQVPRGWQRRPVCQLLIF